MSRRMSSRGFRAALCAAALLAAVGTGPSHAGEAGDHDRARRALEAGEVLPLQSILERVGRQYPGEVMDVELDREGGRWVYEVKVLRSGGSLLKLKVDGRDGTVLHTKEKPAGAQAGKDAGRGGGR